MHLIVYAKLRQNCEIITCWKLINTRYYASHYEIEQSSKANSTLMLNRTSFFDFKDKSCLDLEAIYFYEFNNKGVVLVMTTFKDLVFDWQEVKYSYNDMEKFSQIFTSNIWRWKSLRLQELFQSAFPLCQGTLFYKNWKSSRIVFT